MLESPDGGYGPCGQVWAVIGRCPAMADMAVTTHSQLPSQASAYQSLRCWHSLFLTREESTLLIGFVCRIETRTDNANHDKDLASCGQPPIVVIPLPLKHILSARDHLSKLVEESRVEA